jgi:hypothetical protein
MSHSRGKTNPLTARQLKKPRKCVREGCPFLAHADKKQSGGKYCCGDCKNGGAHGVSCHQLLASEVRLRQLK